MKAALACARWGGASAEMLLLNEPTNHLDIASWIALEEALRRFSGIVVVLQTLGFCRLWGLRISSMRCHGEMGLAESER